MPPLAKPELEIATSNGSSWDFPPAPDQIELILFGPGFGECALIHVGDGRWVVVDSCIDAATGQAVALTYLHSLGVDPATSVVAIVATHWHDDHIRGLADLVQTCRQAMFVCSSAMTVKEFDAMVLAFDGQRMVRASSGVAEVNRVFELLRDAARPRPRRANAGRKILAMDANILSHGCAVTCTALSPSDYEDELALKAISKLSPREKETQFRCPAEQPNLMSVVLHISIGGTQLLLGADLENSADAKRGWKAVLLDTTLPKDRSILFKVPHHGGESAFSAEVWAQLLHREPLAVATPWQRGGRRLPTLEDIARIVDFTPNGFLTANSEVTQSPVTGRPSAVVRQLREMGVRLTRIEPPSGAVRFRNVVNSPAAWNVTTQGSAMRVGSLPAA